MKHFILILLLFTVVASSQKRRISTVDSLKICLEKGNDRVKFKTLCALSEEYSKNDLTQALTSARQALIKARAIKNDTFVSGAYNSIANIFQYRTELDSALLYHTKALKIRQKINDSVAIADSYNNIGIIYDNKGCFPEALQNYIKALYLYEKKNDIAKMAMTNANIGIIYKAHKEYDKALEYYRKANALYLQAKDDFGITVSSGNLGSILINFGNYSESLKYSEIAEKGYKKLGYNRYIGYPVSNMAVVYDSLHRFGIANERYTEAIALHEKYENWYEAANIGNAFANCLIKQKKYHESIAVSEKAKTAAHQTAAHLLEVMANGNLAKAYAKSGSFEQAYRYSNLYNIGKDSLFVKEKTKAIFELETKYQTEKKEKLLLKKEIEARRRNIWLLILSLLALSAIIISYLIYRQQKLRNRQQEQEFQLKSAIAQIETQNKLQEQRLSISRDLHDNIGAQLTFIISSVDNIKYAFDLKNKNLGGKLDSISNFTQSTIVELRDTIWAMNSSAVKFEDLRMRIINFIEKAKIAKEHIAFSFDIDESLNEIKLSSVTGMNIYRTIQEAINNSIKYAEATEISINVADGGSEVLIRIADNGRGFNPDEVINGNGLQNMKKRLKEIGGEITIKSAISKGTIIEIGINKSLLNN